MPEEFNEMQYSSLYEKIDDRLVRELAGSLISEVISWDPNQVTATPIANGEVSLKLGRRLLAHIVPHRHHLRITYGGAPDQKGDIVRSETNLADVMNKLRRRFAEIA